MNVLLIYLTFRITFKCCVLGIGIGYSILNGLVCIYYNVIIAIAIYYLFGSLTSVLPWSTCDNPWNTENCGDPIIGIQSL